MSQAVDLPPDRRLRPPHARRDSRVQVVLAAAVVSIVALIIGAAAGGGKALEPKDARLAHPTGYGPPAPGGYFTLVGAGAWTSLPSDTTCAQQVHRSVWEPRPDNYAPNHTVVSPTAARAALAARPDATAGSADPRWDSWLRARVDGQFAGTTDEIFQWAACKWGLPDDLLRAIAVRESTWYQYETYPSGRPLDNWGSGDIMQPGVPGAAEYCTELARYGPDYQAFYGPGVCPQTFSIVGVKVWEAPAWGLMAGNQNGTFPFVRRSTAFATDYLGAMLRGCVNGWEFWLAHSGAYRANDLWGCVGAWYAGAWNTAGALAYAAKIQQDMRTKPWLGPDWDDMRPSCSALYGCPGPGLQ